MSHSYDMSIDASRYGHEHGPGAMTTEKALMRNTTRPQHCVSFESRKGEAGWAGEDLSEISLCRRDAGH